MNLRKSYAYPIKKQLKSRRFSMDFALTVRWRECYKAEEILLTERRIYEKRNLRKEYMLLVDRICRYTAKYGDIHTAVEKAVTECIAENILADFLRRNRAEVVEVCIFEYDEKREKELIWKAEFEQGVKVGREEGREEGEEYRRRTRIWRYADSTRITQEETAYPKAAEKKEKQRQNQFKW